MPKSINHGGHSEHGEKQDLQEMIDHLLGFVSRCARRVRRGLT
jgi:hypothetical protein